VAAMETQSYTGAASDAGGLSEARAWQSATNGAKLGYAVQLTPILVRESGS
jgi:hypothetical protein